MIPVLIHWFFFSWKRQLWKLPFGPSNNSHHCTVQETSMRILSTSRNISSNYTLWVQENNHRMSLRTQWTYCESDFSLTNGVNNLASKCPYFTWKITMFLGTFWNLLQLKISFQYNLECLLASFPLLYSYHCKILLRPLGKYWRMDNCKTFRYFIKVLTQENLSFLLFNRFCVCKLAHVWTLINSTSIHFAII